MRYSIHIAYLDRRSEKHPDPEYFTGDRKKYEGFLIQVKLKLQVNKDWYQTPLDRVAYVISRFSGNALDLVQGMLHRDGTPRFVDFDDFHDWMDVKFGDPDRKGTARNYIATHRQSNREWSDFFGPWDREMSHAGFTDDESMKAFLERAVSDEVYSELRHHSYDGFSYRQFADLCMHIGDES